MKNEKLILQSRAAYEEKNTMANINLINKIFLKNCKAKICLIKRFTTYSDSKRDQHPTIKVQIL